MTYPGMDDASNERVFLLLQGKSHVNMVTVWFLSPLLFRLTFVSTFGGSRQENSDEQENLHRQVENNDFMDRAIRETGDVGDRVGDIMDMCI